MEMRTVTVVEPREPSGRRSSVPPRKRGPVSEPSGPRRATVAAQNPQLSRVTDFVVADLRDRSRFSRHMTDRNSGRGGG